MKVSFRATVLANEDKLLFRFNNLPVKNVAALLSTFMFVRKLHEGTRASKQQPWGTSFLPDNLGDDLGNSLVQANDVLGCHAQTCKRRDGLMHGFLVSIREANSGRNAWYV